MLSLLNQIGLRPQVISVSNIVTPDGRQITPQAFACKKGNALCNNLRWQRSVRMCVRHQRLRQQTLQTVLLDSAPGNWLIWLVRKVCGWFSLLTFSTWPWRFSLASGSTICRCGSPTAGWTEFQPVHMRTRVT